LTAEGANAATTTRNAVMRRSISADSQNAQDSASTGRNWDGPRWITTRSADVAASASAAQTSRSNAVLPGTDCPEGGRRFKNEQ
jgi:hypothetical protein